MSYTITDYRKGNVLTAEAQQNAARTVAFINDVQTSLPGRLRISSTVRTPSQNAAVGGVANSKHLVSRAEAVDFVPTDGKFTTLLESTLKSIGARHGFEVFKHNVKTGLHYHAEYEPSKKHQQKGKTTTAR